MDATDFEITVEGGEIEGGDVEGVEALGQRDERGVDEIRWSVGVLGHQLKDATDLLRCRCQREQLVRSK